MSAQNSAGWLPVYVLAGGSSSRFPGGKALALIAGQPQLSRLLRELGQLGFTPRVVADRSDRFESLGIECLCDTYPNRGPMGGLAAALADRQGRAGEGWLLLLGCDQLLWKPHWLAAMPPQDHDQATDFDLAVWVQSQEDQARPLTLIPGLFHTRLLPLVRQRCENGRLALKSLCDDPAIRVFQGDWLGEHPADYSFNTPEQLQQLVPKLQL